jgi:RNA polymerase sigma factor (sigma-70 family)
MVPGRPRTILRHLNHLLVREAGQESDAHLLRRFADQREEAAFAALLARHARLVWDVCRHTLGHEQDAEDAFQATFLVLARKAGAIRKGESVGSFLYGVAYRIAMKARHNAAARRAREKRAAGPVERAGAEPGLGELQAILAEEVNRLATKDRAPFVLCCLEGKSKREAAGELGWKEGTVSSRLAHARKLLQSRLARRGVMLAAVLTSVAVTEGVGSASAPAALLEATAKAAPAFASGKVAQVSAPVAALTEGVLRAMFVTKLKWALFVVAAVALVVAGTGALGQQVLGTKPAAPVSQPAARAAASEEPANPERDRRDKQMAKAGDRDLLQGKWVLAATENDKAEVAKHPDGPVSLVDGDKITLKLRLINPNGAQWADLRAWETIDGAFELQPDKKPKRIVIKGTWKNAPLPPATDDPLGKRLFTDPPLAAAAPGDKETTITANYLLDGGVLMLLLPAPGKEPPGDMGVDKGSGQRLFIFIRDKGGDGKPPTSWAEPQTLQGHKGTVRTVAYAPDGQSVASGSDDYTVRIWNARTGELVREMNPSKNYRYVPTGIAAVAYSPDGKGLAIGLADRGFPNLYDPETGKAVTDLTSKTGALPEYAGSAPLLFTPDGKKLIAGPGRGGHFSEQKWPDDIGNAFQMWDTTPGKVHSSFAFGGPDGYWTLAMSRDGTLLASGAVKEDVIVLWKRESGKEVRRFKNGTGGTVSALAFKPDGKWVAVGTATGTIQLHDVETGKVAWSVAESSTKRRINDLSFSWDGKLLAAANWDLNCSVAVIDADTGKVRAQLKGHDGDVEAVMFAPKGYDLVSGGTDKTVRIWKAIAKVNAKAPVWKASDTFPAEKQAAVDSLAFSPDGKFLAVTCHDGFEMWDVAKKKPVPPADGPAGQDRLVFAGFTNDGVGWALRAAADPQGGKDNASYKFALVNAFNGINASPRATFANLWADGLMTAFALSPSGDILAVAEGKRVSLWDAKTGEDLGALAGKHSGNVVTLAFTPDGKWLASGSITPGRGVGGEVRVWDVARRKEVLTIQGAWSFHKLQYSADGKTLACDVQDVIARTQGLKVWAATGKELCYIKQGARGDRPQSFAFAPDGKTILVGWRAPPDEGDATPSLVLYDTVTGAEVAQLEPHGQRVTAVAFSHDGKLLATGDDEGTVKWWQSKTGGKPE